MNIDKTNYQTGNRAIASILLLYYHIIKDNGFGNDQNVYLESLGFDAYEYLDTVVSEDYAFEIEESLLREGAVVYLLCELNDLISEYEKDYIQQKQMIKLLDAYNKHKLDIIPEANDIFKIVTTSSASFSYKVYNEKLELIYKEYILKRFRKLIGEQLKIESSQN